MPRILPYYQHHVFRIIHHIVGEWCSFASVSLPLDFRPALQTCAAVPTSNWEQYAGATLGQRRTTLTQRRCSVLPCRRNPSHPGLTYWTDVRQGRAGEPRGELVLLVNNHPACGPLAPRAPGYLTYHA